MSVEPLTPDKRRELTRRHLLDAAAGFTKGAVYSNFDSKADLILAVMDDRMERQVVALNQQMEAAIADLVEGEGWLILWLEFLLYAARNPEARAKLAEVQRRRRAGTEALIAGEYERHGAAPSRPVEILALISLALFDGLDIARMVDPEAVSDETQHEVLAFLYDTIGVPEGEG